MHSVSARLRVEEADQIAVVRYSEEELAGIANRIRMISDLELSETAIIDYAVTVYVPGDEKQAIDKILASTDIDPCAFKVEGDRHPLPET